MGLGKFLKDPRGPSKVQECVPNSHVIDPSKEPSEDGDCVCELNYEDNELQKSCYRYAAYANRLKTAFVTAARRGSRYLAYTSDIGESFRPVIPRLVVRLGYAVSWSYVIIDVSYHAWKAKLRQEGRFRPGLKPWQKAPQPDKEAAAAAADDRSWKVVAAKEFVFQSLASMGLPAFTIHTIVKHSGFMYKNFRNPTIRKYGPVANGLAIVPFLPFIFDKPVEHAVDYVTLKAESIYDRKHGGDGRPKNRRAKGKDL